MLDSPLILSREGRVASIQMAQPKTLNTIASCLAAARPDPIACAFLLR